MLGVGVGGCLSGWCEGWLNSAHATGKLEPSPSPTTANPQPTAPRPPASDLLEERADAPPDAPRRPDAVYLYGVDVMSTADIKSYFGDYGPRFVEWINDSSCAALLRRGGM